MSALGAAVHWDVSPVSDESMRQMMGVVAHRGPDGMRWEVDGSTGLGQGLLALRRVELEEPAQPIWLPNRSAAVVADCRLDNRSDLRRALGNVSWFQGHPSDAELILAAYEKWDTELVQFILGDFAFIIWDAHRRRVLAARDPFGVRPLFYHSSRKHILLASEPKQILVMPKVPHELDQMVVGEFLFGRFEDLDRSFFTSVRRLRPAHLLIATAAGVDTVRYWNPDPTLEARFDDPQEYFDRFREHLLASVRTRLNTDFPAAAHLSGGLDSSSVVVVAADLLGSMEDPPPHFSALSGLFPGLPCDESSFIHAVGNRVPFEVRAFEPAKVPLLSGLREEIARVNSPFIDFQRGSWLCEAQILRDTSTRTLLTGLGGDELSHEEYYLRDLALQGRFATLASEAYRASRYSWNSFGWLLGDALKPLVPVWVKETRNRWARKQGWVAPQWAELAFVRFFKGCPEVPVVPNPGFRSLVQEWTFRWLNFPAMCWALESVDSHASAAGVSVSHPFLDRQLAEYVLSIPFDARLPEGRWKVLIRRGLSGQLPDLVRDRTRKTSFSSLHVDIMRRNQDALFRELFGTRQWCSSQFVDREAARQDLESLLSAAEMESAEVDALWRVATLELWLRHGLTTIEREHHTSDKSDDY